MWYQSVSKLYIPAPSASRVPSSHCAPRTTTATVADHPPSRAPESAGRRGVVAVVVVVLVVGVAVLRGRRRRRAVCQARAGPGGDDCKQHRERPESQRRQHAEQLRRDEQQAQREDRFDEDRDRSGCAQHPYTQRVGGQQQRREDRRQARARDDELRERHRET